MLTSRLINVDPCVENVCFINEGHCLGGGLVDLLLSVKQAEKEVNLSQVSLLVSLASQAFVDQVANTFVFLTSVISVYRRRRRFCTTTAGQNHTRQLCDSTVTVATGLSTVPERAVKQNAAFIIVISLNLQLLLIL